MVILQDFGRNIASLCITLPDTATTVQDNYSKNQARLFHFRENLKQLSSGNRLLSKIEIWSDKKVTSLEKKCKIGLGNLDTSLSFVDKNFGSCIQSKCSNNLLERCPVKIIIVYKYIIFVLLKFDLPLYVFTA